MRKALIISHNFPPHGGPGVQRVAKFIKYLPEFGWEPIVVCANETACETSDPSLLFDIPSGANILRINAFSWPRLYSKFKQVGLEKWTVPLNLILQCPDAALFWAWKAYAKAMEIVEKENPLVIYSTSGPASDHLLASWLKKRHNLPWFADFRDPWSDNSLIRYPPGYRNLNRLLEKKVVQKADTVCAVSPTILDSLKRHTPRQDKFIVIPNGYDKADVTSRSSADQSIFTLLYTGSFYRGRTPEKVLQAIDHLHKTGKISKENFKALFVGKNVRDHIRGNVSSLVDVLDYVPHRELASFRTMASALLLIIADTPQNQGCLSGKIYEYIASSRPILGVGPINGAARDLLHRTNTGTMVKNEVEAVANEIERLHTAWKRKTPVIHPRVDVIEQYSRKEQTRQLAQEFDKLIEMKSAGVRECGSAGVRR